MDSLLKNPTLTNTKSYLGKEAELYVDRDMGSHSTPHGTPSTLAKPSSRGGRRGKPRGSYTTRKIRMLEREGAQLPP